MRREEVELSERELLKDEIMGISAQLYLRHGMTERGIRGIARRALQTGKVRKLLPVVGMRVVNKEDLLSDLEEAAIELGNSRTVQFAVGRGIKMVRREEA